MTSTEYIESRCKYDNDFARNIELLDKYDFSEFLSHGRSIYNMMDAIEEKYDKEFFQTYGMYVFDNLQADDACEYFSSRYNVWFQECTDWVVKRENGIYGKTKRRDSSG